MNCKLCEFTGKLCEVCEFMGPIRKTETSFSKGVQALESATSGGYVDGGLDVAREVYAQHKRNDSLPITLTMHSSVWAYIEREYLGGSRFPYTLFDIPITIDDRAPHKDTWEAIFNRVPVPVPVPSANQEKKCAENPKHRDSSHKVPLYLCPASIIVAIAHVIAQGHKTPGRTIYNWREAPINLSEYMSAAQRHLIRQIDGQEFDRDLSDHAGFPVRHEWAVAACMAIIVDARECGTLVDDLPKKKGGGAALLDRLTESNKKLLNK